MDATGHVGAGDWQMCRKLVAGVMNPTLCRAQTPAAKDCPEVPPKVPKLKGKVQIGAPWFAWLSDDLCPCDKTCALVKFLSAGCS